MPRGASRRCSMQGATIALGVFVLFASSVCHAQGVPEAIDRGKQKRTLADIRSLATAIMTYAIDHEYYPPTTSMASLRKLIEPDYMRTTPTEDGWGHDLRYSAWQEDEASRGADRFHLLSPGKDGEWEYDDPRRYAPGPIESFASDVVFAVEGFSMEYPAAGFSRAPDWLLQRQREAAVERKALASAATLDSVPLLESEIKWVERELAKVGLLRDKEDELRRVLVGMRANLESIRSVVPSEMQLGDYLDALASIARGGNVSFETRGTETLEHDQYQEAIIEIRVQGAREDTRRFLSRARNSPRFASWGEPQITDSEIGVKVSIFATPPVGEIDPRDCRPVDVQGLAPGDPQIAPLTSRLESLCDDLDEHRDVRVLYTTLEATKQRLQSVVALFEADRPPE